MDSWWILSGVDSRLDSRRRLLIAVGPGRRLFDPIELLVQLRCVNVALRWRWRQLAPLSRLSFFFLPFCFLFIIYLYFFFAFFISPSIASVFHCWFPSLHACGSLAGNSSEIGDCFASEIPLFPAILSFGVWKRRRRRRRRRRGRRGRRGRVSCCSSPRNSHFQSMFNMASACATLAC